MTDFLKILKFESFVVINDVFDFTDKSISAGFTQPDSLIPLNIKKLKLLVIYFASKVISENRPM